MRIVIAMNAFKGSLSSREASSLVADGFRAGFREAELVEMPLADGGDGTVDVLTRLGGRIAEVLVTGPMGKPVNAGVGLLDGGKTAVVESAQASGLALVPPDERDVRRAQSRGVGELMLWASKQGVKRIIVGVGGTAMNDGGIGAAQAAGARILDSRSKQVESGILGLCQVEGVSVGTIPESFEGIEIVAISDVRNPLVGPDGATRIYGPQKGLDQDETIAADRAMARYAAIIARDIGKDPSAVPMSGAGGGLSAALWAFFGARLESGSAFIMEKTGLAREIRKADLVVTGEGAIDSQTAEGKGPFAVAELACRAGVPVLAIGGGLSRDVVANCPLEFSAVFSATPRPMTLDDAVLGARQNLRFAAEQLARAGRVFALSKANSKDFAAGGVVIREGSCGPEVLVIVDRYGMVALPKGHPEAGEPPEAAAVREILEETGIEAAPVGELGVVKHRFPSEDGKVIEKSVRYFVMRPVGGTLAPQKGETLGAAWTTESDLAGMKAYRDTLATVSRGLKMYRNIKSDHRT